MELKGTKTEKNLWTAFAGESQARNKYTFYASKARKDGYVQIAKIFEETAANEKEHAELWFKALHGDAIPGTADNLLDAAEGENYEWERSSVSTKTATASCWRMLRAALCSPATATWSGSAPTAAISSSARMLPRCAPSARIRRHISSSRPRTTKPYSGFKSPHIPQAAAGFFLPPLFCTIPPNACMPFFWPAKCGIL